MDLLNELNESQRAAVEYNDGPLLVIAGAGSGKTRVLTYKIAYLLQKGLEPWTILALTFTNKAANEMKQRIGNLVGHEKARQLRMGTFHSVFSRILRVEGEQLGFAPNFTIYDEADSRSLIKSIVKEMGLDDKLYKPASVHNRISMAKNHLIMPQQYANDAEVLERDRAARMPAISKIYTAYAQRCLKANAMDFDDLLVMTYVLFRDHADVREKYANRFQYVLVDEYQDTNYAQQCIVLQLTKERQQVCVVGDDAQSIYGFRGANIDNILDFQNIYKGAKLLKLERNYRSTQRIVQAANSLIKHNERQIHKDVYSRNAEGEKLILKQAYSDKEEAMIVCKDIRRLKREDKCEYSDFAILYRTNSQSRSFEEEMRKQNIPYRIYGGLSFYQRKEIKDIIAYFRVIANRDDEEAIKRIINYPTRGIGNTTIGKIATSAQKYGVSFWEIITHIGRYQLDVNKSTASKLSMFTTLINSFVEKVATSDAYELGKEIIKVSGISADLFSSTDPESLSRQENLEEFLSGMQDFTEGRKEEGRENEIYLTDYLQEISLISDLDSEGDEESRVVLMTVHAAKGLEFPTVFVVGLEENIFPSPMSCNSMRELEEERRLLYVAITRAEKHCILTCAKNRFRYGKMEFDTPSRFLKDIDPSLMLIESEAGIDDKSGRYFGAESAGRLSKFRDDNFSIDKPYTGSHPWGSDYPDFGNRNQNSRPVASQFRADIKPKLTSPHQAEKAIDPFSPSFKRQLINGGANIRKISKAMTNGGRGDEANANMNTNNYTDMHEGSIIEHQRFGIGTVVKIEGTGENTKATVEFKNLGTKQLLLKFARYKIIG
jgi:DNA helicase-2/ATP-dependent DNA helicase PcrA